MTPTLRGQAAKWLIASLLAVAGCAGAPPATRPAGLDPAGFDPAVRVQDDLYRAANGRWLQTAELPADRAEFGAFHGLRDRSDERVRALVEELQAKPQPDGSDAQKLALYQSAFVDTVTIDRLGLAPLAPALAEIAALRSRAELARWLGRAQGRVDTVLGLWVAPDAGNPEVELVYTRQGGLGLPDRDYYLQDDERFVRARAAYEDYLTRLGTLAGDADAAAHARQVMALERLVAQSHWPRAELRDPLKLFNPMGVDALPTLAPGFDWPAFLDAAGLAGLTRISVSQPNQATALARLLDERPLAEWQAYLRLRLLDGFAEVLPQGFRDARFAFRGQALTGAKEERPRWQRGIVELNGALGEAIGRLYVERHFPPAHKAQMQRLVAQLTAAYGESIDGLAWMGPQTRAQARDKLARMNLKLGYPDHWIDYSALSIRADDAFGNRARAGRFDWERRAARAGRPVDRTRWFTTPQTVNAFYNPFLNEIVFPAAMLQPPFFDPAGDDAANYGAIGAIIGHEISHGFDDSGSRFDGTGRLRNWWTDDDRRAFEAIGARLVAQFEQYQPLPGKTLNGRLTLGENIADLSGLQIAFKAYRRSLGGRPAPVIDGRSGEQRFFLGWAQAWRYKNRDELALQRLSVDPHAPPRFRANGAVVNHDGFHETFGTRPGDGLYKPADERIRLW